jgi:hypothetical protein
LSVSSRPVIIAVLLLLIALLVPVASAFASELPLGPQKIILDTTSPELDDRMFYDIAPTYLPISGSIYGLGIRNVTVTYDNTTRECGTVSGNQVRISCQFLIVSGTEPVIFTIADRQGNVVSDTRNMTGIPFVPHQEDNVMASGFITEENGTPIRDVQIGFETKTIQKDGKPYSPKTISDIYGKYTMRRTIAGPQKIVVQKDGYPTQVRDINIKPSSFDTVENFTLHRGSGMQAPLNVATIIGSLVLGIIILVDVRYRK